VVLKIWEVMRKKNSDDCSRDKLGGGRNNSTKESPGTSSSSFLFLAKIYVYVVAAADKLFYRLSIRCKEKYSNFGRVHAYYDKMVPSTYYGNPRFIISISGYAYLTRVYP